MYDAFDRSNRSSFPHRRGGKAHKKPFTAASFGVRHGFIADPNWPPAQFPAKGSAHQRRQLRVPASFAVSLDGAAPFHVTGNLSLGGAMFLLPDARSPQSLEVISGDARAHAQVLHTRALPSGAVAHHVCFLDAQQARHLWESLG